MTEAENTLAGEQKMTFGCTKLAEKLPEECQNSRPQRQFATLSGSGNLFAKQAEGRTGNFFIVGLNGVERPQSLACRGVEWGQPLGVEVTPNGVQWGDRGTPGGGVRNRRDRRHRRNRGHRDTSALLCSLCGKEFGLCLGTKCFGGLG
jgi:hypothetical protein